MKWELDYNSPVIITYLIVCLIICILNSITRGRINKWLFSSYRSSPLNPLTYLRMFTHSLGHQNWEHFTSNFIYILLVGPMIEEKYGSIPLIGMFLITSFIIALYNIIVSNYRITGASGNVYMLIVLSSFSNITEGKIPVTLILIFIFFLMGEIRKGILEGNRKIYHDGHIIGALCGIAFGFLFFYFPNLPIPFIK